MIDMSAVSSAIDALQAEKSAIEATLAQMRSEALAERALKAHGREAGAFAGAGDALALAAVRLKEIDRAMEQVREDADFVQTHDEYVALLVSIAPLKQEFDAAIKAFRNNSEYDYAEMLAAIGSWRHPFTSFDTCYRTSSAEMRRRADLFLAAERREREASVRFCGMDNRLKALVQRHPALANVSPDKAATEGRTE